jgi:hypothetical protein
MTRDMLLAQIVEYGLTVGQLGFPISPKDIAEPRNAKNSRLDGTRRGIIWFRDLCPCL